MDRTKQNNLDNYHAEETDRAIIQDDKSESSYNNYDLFETDPIEYNNINGLDNFPDNTEAVYNIEEDAGLNTNIDDTLNDILNDDTKSDDICSIDELVERILRNDSLDTTDSFSECETTYPTSQNTTQSRQRQADEIDTKDTALIVEIEHLWNKLLQVWPNAINQTDATKKIEQLWKSLRGNDYIDDDTFLNDILSAKDTTELEMSDIEDILEELTSVTNLDDPIFNTIHDSDIGLEDSSIEYTENLLNDDLDIQISEPEEDITEQEYYDEIDTDNIYDTLIIDSCYRDEDDIDNVQSLFKDKNIIREEDNSTEVETALHINQEKTKYTTPSNDMASSVTETSSINTYNNDDKKHHVWQLISISAIAFIAALAVMQYLKDPQNEEADTNLMPDHEKANHLPGWNRDLPANISNQLPHKTSNPTQQSSKNHDATSVNTVKNHTTEIETSKIIYKNITEKHTRTNTEKTKQPGNTSSVKADLQHADELIETIDGNKENKWSLNLMSIYAQENTSHYELELLRNEGIEAELHPVIINDKLWHRIRINGFNSKKSAINYMEIVEKKTGINKYWLSRQH